MSINRTRRAEVNCGSGELLQATQSFDVGGVVEVNEIIPDGSTNLQLFVSLAAGALMLFSIVVSGGALTIKTNSSSVPDDTFTILPGEPFHWTSDDGIDEPLDASITSLFVTNASGAAARLEIQAASDVTPE